MKREECKEKGLCFQCGKTSLSGKIRCEEHHNKNLEHNRNFKQKAKKNGLCGSCCVAPRKVGKSMCQTCLDKHAEHARLNHIIKREQCITAYGGRCRCCGLSSHIYLQLDHVNNDGNVHRKAIFNRREGKMYEWAVSNNFPKNLQLLCANCHQAKTTRGGCSDSDHAAMRHQSS